MCEEGKEEVLTELLMKRLSSFSGTRRGLSQKPAISKYSSSLHNESVIDQLPWTIRTRMR